MNVQALLIMWVQNQLVSIPEEVLIFLCQYKLWKSLSKYNMN